MQSIERHNPRKTGVKFDDELNVVRRQANDARQYYPRSDSVILV
jgi:hypothetical protein